MLTRLRTRDADIGPRTAASPAPGICRVAHESRHGQACNEEAFRYFLSVERRAAERSSRPFLLLLVGVRRRAGLSGRIEPDIGAHLFSLLWRCLRETDVVGWFRDGRVVGALLTQPAGAAVPGAAAIQDRVRATFCRSLHQDVASRLRIRVCVLPAKPRPYR